ncbi:conserved hypothetical protein [Culex quinquefasciatus]|uniref:Uncharacterized protein n=1 Tax=Culex quinquefasciatus TaxID=7176 RepID=B0XEX9_CULQU|nr:conserved hypothetical protein [Culex quinquefasciatus]|eukprot:XP_001868201.1 conserved hypothetical protein [Culex quinquefasciatus]
MSRNLKASKTEMRRVLLFYGLTLSTNDESLLDAILLDLCTFYDLHCTCRNFQTGLHQFPDVSSNFLRSSCQFSAVNFNPTSVISHTHTLELKKSQNRRRGVAPESGTQRRRLLVQVRCEGVVLDEPTPQVWSGVDESPLWKEGAESLSNPASEHKTLDFEEVEVGTSTSWVGVSVNIKNDVTRLINQYAEIKIHNIYWFLMFNHQIFKSLNLQIFKFSNLQIYKSSNLQIFKSSNLQIFKSSNLQIFQIFKSSNLQIFKSSNLQIFKSSNLQIFKSSNLQIFKSSNLQIFKSSIFKSSIFKSSIFNLQIFNLQSSIFQL